MRFSHDFFRRDEPELLHRIQRVTKSQDVCTGEVKSLKEEMEAIADKLQSFSSRMDQRLKTIMSAVDLDYQQRMASCALSYQMISNLASNLTSLPPPCQSEGQSSNQEPEKEQIEINIPTTKSLAVENPVSPKSVHDISPLMALSMVAELDREYSFSCARS